MLVNHTHERLAGLGLPGMAKAFDDQLRQPDAATLTFEVRLGLMIDREVTERDNKRLVARLKFAALRQAAVIEDIDLRTPRGIERAFFAKLVDGDWIARKQNLLITGPTGVGKSWIARARPQGLPRQPFRPLPSHAAAVRSAGAGTRRRTTCTAAQGAVAGRTPYPR